MLHLVHQAAHICWHGEHAQRVQTAVQHVRLDTHLVEGFGESTNGLVGIFAVEQVDLLKGTAVGFHAAETSHLDNYGRDAFQLILAGLKFTRTLEHIAIYQTKLYFTLFHNDFSVFCKKTEGKDNDFSEMIKIEVVKYGKSFVLKMDKENE
jgi:hypothetical protein